MGDSGDEGQGGPIEPTAGHATSTFLRRLGTLLAWLDQEHGFSANVREEDLVFLTDPVHLDAYSEMLDGADWTTVTRSNARDFYLNLARKLVMALQAEESPDHTAHVRALIALWNG
jgi:hypothetical protein